MSELVVFLAPVGPAGGVLDVLADLSGAGLLDPFLWVTDTGVAGADHPAAYVVQGRRDATTVQDVVANRRYPRLRLCVLVPLFDGARTVSSQAEEELAHVIRWRAGNQVEVTRIRCLLAPHGAGGDYSDAARDSWHNVLVAPEDALGPDSGLSLLSNTDPVDVGRYAAPVVAGVMGLWAGMAKSGLDDLALPAGPGIRAVRSFYRRVDADDVEGELRSRVFDTQPELPLPQDATARSVYLEDPPRACRTMAYALWQHHHKVLKGHRMPPPANPPKPLSAMAAIKWFFGFLWDALKSAPGDWLDAKRKQYASRIAATVQRTILGSAPSAYRIVVDGMTADGLPAGWQDIRAASGELDALDLGPFQEEPRVDLSPVWKDYIGGALTLCDAGARATHMPPILVGADRGVLRSVAQCSPSPEDAFTAMPSHLAGRTGRPAPGTQPVSVQAGDVLGAELLNRRLQQLAQDPSLAHDAGRTAHALGEWRARHDLTYPGQVGGVLGQQLTTTVHEVRQLLDRLRAASSDGGNDGERGYSRIARLMKIFLLCAVLGIGVVWALYYFDIIALLTAWLAMPVILMIWLLASFLTFFKGQRELFADFNRRQALLSAAEVDRLNLRYAIKDLRRLVDAYGQFLLWTRVLGRLLGQPFGPPPSTAATGLNIARGLPRTTRIARAEVDEAAMADAAAVLRKDLYTTGWLTESWNATLNAAPARLGPRGHELIGNPQAIFDLQGRPLDGSPQQLWADSLVQAGIDPATGDQRWRTVRGWLDPNGQRAALGLALMSRVRGMEQGAPPAGPLSEFLSGIDQQQVRVGQRFLGEHFTDQALSTEAGRVTLDQPAGWRHGLSGALVLVQYTDALPADMFRAAGAVSTPPPPVPPPSRVPGPTIQGPVF